MDKSFFDFEIGALRGGKLSLRAFAGKPVLLVNTASKCGFTPQYKALQQLWRDQRGAGLVVLGVPSNDFGAQEPGDAGEIASFCEVNFGVDFPLTEKVHVRGQAAHPLFRWVAAEGGFLAKPRWNFFKYLIGPDGHLRDWFSSLTSPDSGRLRRAVTTLLAETPRRG